MLSNFRSPEIIIIILTEKFQFLSRIPNNHVPIFISCTCQLYYVMVYMYGFILVSRMHPGPTSTCLGTSPSPLIDSSLSE